jgi:nucleoside phosphorylase
MSVDIVILTAIPEELEAARSALGVDPGRRQKIEDRTWFSGEIYSERTHSTYSFKLACLGEAGNIRSAEVATIALVNDQLKPKVMILVGIAAGIKGKTKIGEVFFSESVFAYEPGVSTEDGFQPRPEMPGVFSTIRDDVTIYQSFSERLKRIRSTFQKIGDFPIAKPDRAVFYSEHVCTDIKVDTCGIASGEKLLRDGQILKDIHQGQHSRVKIGEMEAAGFANVCSGRKIDWLVIRGVSDFGDSDKNDDFHGFAAKVAFSVVADFLIHGLCIESASPATNRQSPSKAENKVFSGSNYSARLHILRFLQGEEQDNRRVTVRNIMDSAQIAGYQDSEILISLKELRKSEYIDGDAYINMTQRGGIESDKLIQDYQMGLELETNRLLEKLLPHDFERVCIQAGIPDNVLRYKANQIEHSLDVVKYLAPQGLLKLESLLEIIYRVAPHLRG